MHTINSAGASYRMPTFEEFIKMKDSPKKSKIVSEPIWVYLEREMRENVHLKPYSENVGRWLKVLKQRVIQRQKERRNVFKNMDKAVGPSWFLQLSLQQKRVLSGLKQSMHEDLTEELPRRTQRSLAELGLAPGLRDAVVMRAMKDSEEDPSLFMWNLYSMVFHSKPSTLQTDYNINARIMMSSFVDLEIDSLLAKLEEMLHCPIPKRPPPEKKKLPPKKILASPYLQTQQVVGCPQGPRKPQPKRAVPINYRFKLKDEQLKKRRQSAMPSQTDSRICTYKFWKPPLGFREKVGADMHAKLLAEKTEELKRKAVPRHAHALAQHQLAFQVGGVSFLNGRPHYILNSVYTHIKYVPIWGGTKIVNEEPIPIIVGFTLVQEGALKCYGRCDCEDTYDDVIDYLQSTKCRCGHRYDLHHPPKARGEILPKYFHPPTKSEPLWFDEAKIYQMDTLEDFVKECVSKAVLSDEPLTEETESISTSNLTITQMLKTLMADISKSEFIIPHLPDVHLLPVLRAWVQLRVRGPLTPAQQRNQKLKVDTWWNNLSRVNLEMQCPSLMFDVEMRKHLTFAYWDIIKPLSQVIYRQWLRECKQTQVLETRLWWPSMMFEYFQAKRFKKAFFTYSAPRERDTNPFNPFGPGM